MCTPDNFFVKAEREKLTAESSTSNKTGKTSKSFDDIGKMIGQRWNSMQGQEQELAGYKELAKADTERYRKEMEKYKEEMQHQDSKPAAVVTSTTSLSSTPVITTTAANQFSDSEPATVVASTSRLSTPAITIAAASGNGASTVAAGLAVAAAQQQGREGNQRPAHAPAAASSTSIDDQVLKLVLRHQQSTSSPYPKGAILQLLLNQKLSMEQRQQETTEELNQLQLRIKIVDTMIAKEAALGPGGVPNLSSLGPGFGLGSSASHVPPSSTLQQGNSALNALMNSTLGRGAQLSCPQSHPPRYHLVLLLKYPPNPLARRTSWWDSWVCNNSIVES